MRGGIAVPNFMPQDTAVRVAILGLAQRVAARGGRLYIVGGGLRDALLGRAVHDVDLSVAGLSADSLIAELPGAKRVGNQFPVLRANLGGSVCEVALARKELKTGVGHRGFETVSGPEVSIEADLLRRDLTVNAMAYDPLTDRLIDPFGGRQDIAAGELCAVSRAFGEDPLRVYRTARFAAQLGFTVARPTLALMGDLVPELPSLSTERVVREMERALLAPRPDLFFRTLADAGALGAHFAEIAALRGVPQPPRHHPEGDAFEHTMLVLQCAAEMSAAPDVRFGALVHDLGKATTPEEELPFHPGHDDRGVELVGSLGRRLGLSTQRIRAGQLAALRHMRVHKVHEMRGVKVVDLLQEAARTTLGVEGLAIVAHADGLGRGGDARRRDGRAPLVELDAARRAVRGGDVKAPPGKKLGAALRAAQGEAVERRLQELQRV